MSNPVPSRPGDAEQMQPLAPRVRFFPPLHEQRQCFLLDTLIDYSRISSPDFEQAGCDQKECHIISLSVLDVGCGEGSLLTNLHQPAFSLPLSSRFYDKYGINKDAKIKATMDLYPPRKIVRLVGLDISRESLRLANEQVKTGQGELYLLRQLLRNLSYYIR
jgi:SAM-dependent methyltransferase